jgi:hypothetical protein
VQGALPQIVLLAPEHRGPEAEGQGGDDAAILDRLARFRQFGDRRPHLFSLTVGDVTGLGLEPARAGGFGHHRVNAVSQRHLQSLERHIEGFGHPGVQRIEFDGAVAIAPGPGHIAREPFEGERRLHRVGVGDRPCIRVGHGLSLPAYTPGSPLLQSMPPG